MTEGSPLKPVWTAGWLTVVCVDGPASPSRDDCQHPEVLAAPCIKATSRAGLLAAAAGRTGARQDV